MSAVTPLHKTYSSGFISENEDPLVRGLALRSLCSLKLESILEYVDRPLQRGLTDISAYVRKTAVLGVLKVCMIEFSSVTSSNRYSYGVIVRLTISVHLW